MRWRHMTRRDAWLEHVEFFTELGVDGVSRDPAWSRRGDVGVVEDDTIGGVLVPRPDLVRQKLSEIRSNLGECTRCKLHTGRTNLVFGVGDPEADLMFVGEAPGRDEDLQGEPFVGRAGQL